MRLHKCILIGMVFAIAIWLIYPAVSFACVGTGANTYECCTVCCQGPQECTSYLTDGPNTCEFNLYCLVNPVYCSNICLQMQVCPFSLVLDEDEIKLDVLRDIRDTRMLKNALGISLVNLYYQHAEEVATILLADEDLLVLSANITDEIAERALEADSDEEMVIDRELVESILEVTDLISEEAGPELRRTIMMIQGEIKRKRQFRKLGITIN